MKNKIAKLTLFSLLAAALLAAPTLARAQDTSGSAASTNAPVKKQRTSLPFHGKVAAVDTNVMTFTVGTTTIAINSKTKITKDGEPAVFADVVLGAQVSGSYKKDADGKLNATTVKISEKKIKKETTPQ